MAIRLLRWPEDREALMALETGFETRTVLTVLPSARHFALEERAIDPPQRKAYDLAAEVDELPGYSCVLIAEQDGSLAGMAAFRLEAWNRRANLLHLYLAPSARGQGLGRKLIDETLIRAKALNARVLWLETQNINIPAIRFYERMGFHCCGLDTSLYDPAALPDETALYFARNL